MKKEDKNQIIQRRENKLVAFFVPPVAPQRKGSNLPGALHFRSR